MSVERAVGYQRGDRIIHVAPDGEHLLEPFGGYVPMQRLVGTAAIRSAAERWLEANPVEANADRLSTPLPPEIDGSEITEPLPQTEEDKEDIELLTTKAVELAA